MSMEDYIAARKEGIKQLHALESRGQDPYLPVLAELVPKLNQMAQVPLGLVQIGLDQIEGTATKGRTTAFARGFLPLLEQDSEFATKWSILYDGIVEDGLRQPIVALEYYNRFYIVEGNKRVSVMRRLDAVNIEANVTRVLPEAEDSERYRVYQEFLSFYADTKLNFIVFSREGSYERLYKLIGKTPGEKWTPEDLFDFQSCFYRFQQAYAARLGGEIPMSACDALLIYLEVFGYNNSVEKTPNEFEQDIERIRSEFVVAAGTISGSRCSSIMPSHFMQSVPRRSSPASKYALSNSMVIPPLFCKPPASAAKGRQTDRRTALVQPGQADRFPKAAREEAVPQSASTCPHTSRAARTAPSAR